MSVISLKYPDIFLKSFIKELPQSLIKWSLLNETFRKVSLRNSLIKESLIKKKSH